MPAAEPFNIALPAPSAGEQGTLSALRRAVNAVTAPRPGGEARLGLGVASLDRALGGGLGQRRPA